MHLHKSAVVAPVLAVFLACSAAAPAIADPAPHTSVNRPASTNDAHWEFTGYFANGNTCNITKELRRSGGYPVEPSSGCYRTEKGYYFYYYTT